MMFTDFKHVRHDCEMAYIRTGHICLCAICGGTSYMRDDQWSEVLEKRAQMKLRLEALDAAQVRTT